MAAPKRQVGEKRNGAREEKERGITGDGDGESYRAEVGSGDSTFPLEAV